MLEGVDMAAGRRIAERSGKTGPRLTGVATLLAGTALAAISFAVPQTAHAQTADQLGGLVQTNPDAQLLLEADELIYDNDAATISAAGNVRIDYDGTRLVADRVTYVENGGRLIAIGNVEILQADGTRVTADEIDITDDFRDGFVNALRVVTTDNTRFAAESAERRNGTTTIFNNGVYTACEPCKERPEKPPIWQVKAQRIIWNGEEKTVRFENASFEFFGVPLARLPVFTTADPTVRRKTGFLSPRFRFADELGFGVTVPYFINLAPNYDLTLAVTGYTRQGFLAEADFRHRLENGIYTLKIAGIHQFQPDAFDFNTVDTLSENRGMIATTGLFNINPRWTFGWNGLLQSDKNFSRTYAVTGFNDYVVRNQAFLTGLSGSNYFDARLMKFNVQENVVTGWDERQPAVLPSLDYNYVVGQPVGGGQLSFNVNTRGIVRENADVRTAFGDDSFALFGAEGNSWRMTTETEWKREIIAPGGLVVAPLLHARGDVTILDATGTGALVDSASGAVLGSDGTYWRGMVTAGLEVRWPILFSTASASHVIEPMAQVFARPDATFAGVLPNEDAQSLVFDASTLFERDKYSGFDRIEGGTRANLGIRYTGVLGGGWTAAGLFGQSFHLAGENPYATADLANAGTDSGLETDRSDYVGALSVRSDTGFAAAVGGSFDDDDFRLRRAEVGVGYASDVFSLSTRYAFVGAQPGYGYDFDRQEISASGSLRFAENWRVLASAAYDLEQSRLDRHSIGFAYDDECFIFQAAYVENRDTNNAVSRSIGFKLSLRTIGDLGATTDDLDF